MPAPAYSFSPQFATIRSQSPLAGMRPVVSVPEIRHTALTFERFEPFKIRSEQPELVTGGIAAGISEGAGKALEGITAAYVGQREKKEAREKEDREHARAIELANIRSKGTPEEEEYQRKYRELSLQNIQSQIEQRGGDKKPVVPVRPAGQFQRPPIVEPEEGLPTETKPPINFTTPIIGDVNVSSLQGITPPIAENTNVQENLTSSISEIKAKIAQNAPASMRFEIKRALDQNNLDQLEQWRDKFGIVNSNDLQQLRFKIASLNRLNKNNAVAETTPAEALKKRMAEQKEEDLQKLRMQIAQESGQSPLVSIPVPRNILAPEGVIASQADFSQLPLVPISEGEAEKLASVTIPPSPFPQTPQQMADLAEEQQLSLREKKLQPIMSQLDIEGRQEADARQQAQGMEPVLLPREVSEPTGPNQFLGRYESFEDAIYANEQLAKALPGYQTQEVAEGVDENGMPFYEVKAPVRKAPGTSTTGVPEGMKIKSAKTDETGKTVVEYEPEIPKAKQIETLKQPVQSNETMLKAIRQIKSIYKGISPATGLTGSIMQWIPASDAADVRQLIKVLKGNIAFKALSDMRRASPTGAAVGSVTEKELDLLGNTMGAIDPAMSEFLFTENLNKIEEILTNYNNGVKQEIEALEKPQNFKPIQGSSQIKEGTKAINRQTGERIIFKNGQWIPAQ